MKNRHPTPSTGLCFYIDVLYIQTQDATTFRKSPRCRVVEEPLLDAMGSMSARTHGAMPCDKAHEKFMNCISYPPNMEVFDYSTAFYELARYARRLEALSISTRLGLFLFFYASI